VENKEVENKEVENKEEFAQAKESAIPSSDNSSDQFGRFLVFAALSVVLFVVLTQFVKGAKVPIEQFMGIELQAPLDLRSYAKERGYELGGIVRGDDYVISMKKELPNALILVRYAEDKDIVERVELRVVFDNDEACQYFDDSFVGQVKEKYASTFALPELANTTDERDREISILSCEYNYFSEQYHTFIKFSSAEETQDRLKIARELISEDNKDIEQKNTRVLVKEVIKDI